MRWKRYRPTLWRRILRGKATGFWTFSILMTVTGPLILPQWRRLGIVVPTLIACALGGVIAAYWRGRTKMVSDVVVEEIEKGEKYTAQYCTQAQLQEACDMTKEYYGGEYVAGDIAEQWRLANPEGFVSITNAAGELCACFGVLGLDAGFQGEFYIGRVRDTELRGTDILNFQDTKKCQKAYLSGIVVREPRTFASGTRFRVMLWVMLQYYRKHFGFQRSRTLYALAANPESERLIRALGFSLVCIGEQRDDRCSLYELKVDKSVWDRVSQTAFDFSGVCKTLW